MDRAIAYSEVYEIIQLMGKEYHDKIPDKLLEIINEERNKEYKPNISTNTPLSKQKIHKRTYDILGMIQLNYWCKNDNEKEELLKKFNENKKKMEMELYEKYNPNEIFKNNNVIEEKEMDSCKELIECKESKIKKIIGKLLAFFHIKK